MIILPTNQAVHIGKKMMNKYPDFKYIFLGTNNDGETEFPDREQYTNVRDIERIDGEDVVVLQCGAPRPNSSNITLKHVLCSIHNPQYSEGKKKISGEYVKVYRPLGVKAKSIQIFYLYPEYEMQDWPDKTGSINAIRNDLDIYMRMYGVTRFFTIDSHFSADDWAKNYPIIDVTVMDKFVEKAIEKGYDNPVLLGPDGGILGRANLHKMKVMVIEKERINSYASNMECPRDLADQLKGRNVLSLDDVLETGGTMKDAGTIFRECGPQRLGAAITHLRLERGYKNIEGIFDDVFVSNTIDTPYAINGVDVTDRVAETLKKHA